MKEFSSQWQKSKNPGKQRKYRANAPKHKRGQFVTARLKDTLREKLGTKTLSIRAGDKVEVLRGDYTGKRGTVDRVDRENYRIYVNGIDRETVSGSETMVSIDPSNLRLVKLDLDDDMRVEKYGLTDAEKDEIQVVEEEPADTESGAEESEDDTAEAADEDTSDEDVDYDEIVSGNIDEVKDAAKRDGVEYAALLAAEKDGKARKTLIEWLENQVNDDE